MMHRTFAAVLAAGMALVLSAALAPGAAAQEPPEWDDSYYPFAREGAYLGLGTLFALENFDTEPAIDDPDAPSDITADDGGGLYLRAGYRIHPRLAAELMFQYYWGFEVKDRNGVFDVVDDKFDGWSLTGNAKLYPLLGRIQPYGVVGLGALVFKEKRGDDAGFAARLGGGLDFYVTDRFVIDAEAVYLFPAGSISEFQLATFQAGVQYRY